ncbi:MAG: putative CAMK family protein kinase [Streblomastix strix]|uniref:Putative CAMK family protein kinase n=1 Tax=Streblomastix strix TaxID=222440 RepID=A0A5J4VPP5_9EUKA|nr:MAG: putative CAMK family protein kinase [Streblomastix strix]
MNNKELNQEVQQQQEQKNKTGQNSQEQSVIDDQDDTQSVGSQQSSFVDYEEILRQSEFVPIRPLGRGAFGIVYEVYDRQYGIVAVKIIQKEKFDIRELEAEKCPFIMDHIQQKPNKNYQILILEYSNTNTLNIFAKQPQISLPSYILRTLMKQILEGMRIFHETGLVHRDIKCDNILLHCPPRTGRVYAKISDFGFAKKEDLNNEQTYFAGTIHYVSPEQFLAHPIITHKGDIYALGITFYNIITHKYPINQPTFEKQGKKMAKLKSIERPQEIKDDILWDLLSKMLEFDTNKRISATEALQHPYFTLPEAIADISKEQLELAQQSTDLEENSFFLFENKISKYDQIPSYIFPESEIKKFLPKDIPNQNEESLHFFNWEQLLELNIMKLINKILSVENELIIEQIVKLVKRIVDELSKDVEEGKPNPLLKEIEKDGTLSKLIEIFRNDKYLNKYINTYAAQKIKNSLPPQIPTITYNPTILNQTPLYRQGGLSDYGISQSASIYTTNECRYIITSHMSSITNLSLHPHLMLLLSSSEDGTVALTEILHTSKQVQPSGVQGANPPPNQSVINERLQSYKQSYRTATFKILEPKWHFLNSYQNPQIKRLQMNNMKLIGFKNEIGTKHNVKIEIGNTEPSNSSELQQQQPQQENTSRSLISFNPINCVIFLPYLESHNDRKRKQWLNNIGNGFGQLQKENPQVLKMSQDLGCFATGCSDGKISVYGLPDPKMQMIDNNNKLQPNKMFEIIGHKDAVFSIDETQQQSGLYRGVGIPHQGQVINETRLVSGSADGTVRVWKIRSDGTIPTAAQTSGSKDIGHNSFYLQERVFRHTPSISNSVVATWNNERQKINRNENMNYNRDEIQFLSEREVLEDKWQESDIPSSVLFDPMNMNNVIAGYVSGDIVRFDIETNQELGYARIGSQNKVERIISVSKSRIVPHYSKGLMVPLLVTTNLGYLHLIEPNTLHTIASIKVPNDQNYIKTAVNNIQTKYNQNLTVVALEERIKHPKRIIIEPIISNHPIYSQQVYFSSLNDRIERLLRRNVQIGFSLTNQQIIEPSPLQMWKYDISAQLTVRNIFVNATYLQSDSLIAASTNTGHIIMYDIRHNGHKELGRVAEGSDVERNKIIYSQSVTSQVAHSHHNILVSGNDDGLIKIFCGNPV